MFNRIMLYCRGRMCCVRVTPFVRRKKKTNPFFVVITTLEYCAAGLLLRKLFEFPEYSSPIPGLTHDSGSVFRFFFLFVLQAYIIKLRSKPIDRKIILNSFSKSTAVRTDVAPVVVWKRHDIIMLKRDEKKKK